MHGSIQLAPGFEISRIVTGLWQVADMERNGKTLNPEETAQYMMPYVDAGFTSFDMADHYGSSEIIAGYFINNNSLGDRTQLFTKWVPTPGKISRADVRHAVLQALDRMQSPSIDLMQYHAWKYSDARWLDGLFYLNELKEKGLINHIGVTNFDAVHLKMALDTGIPIVSNQICHSLIDQRANGKLKKVCEDYNVKLLAFGTLAGGFLTDKWFGKPEPTDDELTTWSEMKYKRFIDVAGGWDVLQQLLKTINSVAEKHEVSIANISSRYILENPAVAAIIIGARLGLSSHIEDNKAMLDIELTQDDLNKIQEAQQRMQPIPGDCGDEYRRPPYLTASGDLSHHIATIPNAFESVSIGKDRQQVFSGTEWEGFAGYCRAIKDGNRILISGTTATHGEKLIGGSDPASQTHFIIDKIEGAVESLRGSLSDVIRTRVYVNDVDDWEAVARAHGDRFGKINPSNTLVQAGLIGEGYKVEIEAEAVIKY